jgi:hypothetical protein
LLSAQLGTRQKSLPSARRRTLGKAHFAESLDAEWAVPSVHSANMGIPVVQARA